MGQSSSRQLSAADSRGLPTPVAALSGGNSAEADAGLASPFASAGAAGSRASPFEAAAAGASPFAVAASPFEALAAQEPSPFAAVAAAAEEPSPFAAAAATEEPSPFAAAAADVSPFAAAATADADEASPFAAAAALPQGGTAEASRQASMQVQPGAEGFDSKANDVLASFARMEQVQRQLSNASRTASLNGRSPGLSRAASSLGSGRRPSRTNSAKGGAQ